MADPRSYDEIQRDAVLTRCAGCGRSFYMTVPRRRCFDCEPKDYREASRR